MTSPAAADIDPRKTTIVVEKLNKSFNGTPVLHDINLNVKAGELLALLGPSGSGKTTLLRLIAGLETPDNGRISFAGADTTRVPVQKREVGFVFQHYALFKHMTVADNISYGLRARRRSERPSKSEIAERVAALLDLIKLGTFADRYPSQLSGGQRQRVALARALAVEPRVLLLDEPFGALDAQVRKDLRRWLREIHERTGQTTLFVTHDQDEALELSDRVAVLHAGRVEQVGTPAEVQDHPSSVPVLKFLGDAAEFGAHVRAGKLWIDGIATQIDAASHADGPANLYVRPWHFAVANSEAAHVSGIVRSIYRAQGKAHVGIDVPQGFFNAQLAESAPPKIGDPIDLKITGGHVFR